MSDDKSSCHKIQCVPSSRRSAFPDFFPTMVGDGMTEISGRGYYQEYRTTSRMRSNPAPSETEKMKYFKIQGGKRGR